MPPAFRLREYPLIFITDRSRSGGRSNREVIRAVLEGGARWIMYRETDLNDNDFYNESLAIKQICEDVGAGLIIHDRLDIAALIRADGIHLGEGNLPLRVVKEYMGEDFIVGYSAHSEKEALSKAWEGADYLTYSPIFPITHKQYTTEPHGIEGAKSVCAKIDKPVFLLGGIGFDELKKIRSEIPNAKIACVSLLSEVKDIVEMTEQVIAALGAPIPEDDPKI